MKLFFLYTCSILLFFSNSNAQNGNFDVGARSKGLGNSNSNLTDEWSIFNNVGGISGVEDGSVFFSYDRYFGIEGFDGVAAGAIHPFKFGSVGVSAYKFGDELFSEQVVSAAFGNKIGFVRLGLKANYYQMRIDEFGTAGSMFFDLGGIVELFPKLSFGAFISNFTLSHLNNVEKTKMPVIMKAGLLYMPVNEVRLNLDLYKDVDYKPIIKAGIEYVIVDKFYLRTGINTNPVKGFFGAGLYLNRFQIDYAVGTHHLLGTSHQASVSYTYLKRDEN